MPKFTIERQYLLPVYRHTTYEAKDLAAALALDAENDDWTDAKHSYDGAGPEHVTYAWKGEVAYPLGNMAGLPIPDEFADKTDERDHLHAAAPDMLAALKAVRSEFNVEQTDGGKYVGIGYASDALPRVIHLLDTIIAKAEGREG